MNNQGMNIERVRKAVRAELLGAGSLITKIANAVVAAVEVAASTSIESFEDERSVTEGEETISGPKSEIKAVAETLNCSASSGSIIHEIETLKKDLADALRRGETEAKYAEYYEGVLECLYQNLDLEVEAGDASYYIDELVQKYQEARSGLAQRNVELSACKRRVEQLEKDLTKA